MAHYKKDGTLDMRYSSSKAAVASGNYGSSYQSSYSYTPSYRDSGTRSYHDTARSSTARSDSLNYKKDGTLDMRYSSSKQVMASGGTIRSSHESTPASASSIHYKKDGTLDMRYKSSQEIAKKMETLNISSSDKSTRSGDQHYKKDGTLDRRFKSSTTPATNGVRLTKYGLPDLRTNEGKAWVDAQARAWDPTNEIPDWVPHKKDGTPDVSKALTRRFFDNKPLPTLRRDDYYERKAEDFFNSFQRQLEREVPICRQPPQLECTVLLRREFEVIDNSSDDDIRKMIPDRITQLDYTRDLDMKDEVHLGQGSFGVVVKGVWNTRTVAVKKLHNKMLTKREKAAFIKETALLSCLGEHENIVQLLGYTLDPLTLVMELVELGSLSYLLHYCEDERIEAKMTDGRVKKNILLGICYGMAQLSDSGIVHGDLKPQNILISKDFVPKIADFGLATLRAKVTSTVSSHILSGCMDDDDDTNMGGACGTAAYMAPELLRAGKRPDVSTDVYSFGILLNEFIQEEEPFYEQYRNFFGKGPYAAALHAKDGYRPVIHTKKTPAPLKRLIESCWHPSPSRRPSFNEIAKSLAEITIPNSFEVSGRG